MTDSMREGINGLTNDKKVDLYRDGERETQGQASYKWMISRVKLPGVESGYTCMGCIFFFFPILRLCSSVQGRQCTQGLRGIGQSTRCVSPPGWIKHGFFEEGIMSQSESRYSLGLITMVKKACRGSQLAVLAG